MHIKKYLKYLTKKNPIRKCINKNKFPNKKLFANSQHVLN